MGVYLAGQVVSIKTAQDIARQNSTAEHNPWVLIYLLNEAGGTILHAPSFLPLFA